MTGDRRHDRVGFADHLLLSAVAAFTTWAAMWSWRGFTTLSSVFLVSLIVVGFAVAVSGALARWRRLPGVVVVLVQVVVGGAATCQVIASRPYPGTAVRRALADAVDAANTYPSPVPTTELVTVQPLLVVGGFVAMLLVDLCASTLRRVPLAGLPLLAVYSVPISLLERSLSWPVFAATAAGFLLMLFLQEEQHLSRWGRSLDGSSAPVRRLSSSVRASALAVGSIAMAAAVLAPAVVPTLDISVFDVGPGNGGDGDIEVTNPMVDLREDLVRRADVDLVTIRTDDTAPDHLRISVLNRFTGNEWSGGNREVPGSNLAQGDVPAPEDINPGLVAFEDVDYQVDIAEEFKSRWLPTQAPITSIVADGDWRFDETTMDFLSSDDGLDTAGMSYTMTATLPTYADDRLLSLNSSVTAAPEQFTELPTDLPPAIADYGRQATSGATTDFQRAVLLNQFFRETGGFTYALPTDPEGGVGTGELVDFLDPDARGGRVGYCEQYAAAMGVMARQLGIPARVAVGFLQPDPVAGQPGTFVYSSHDLHAWTELYFPGAGWVLFDPTPDTRTRGSQPTYADQVVDPVSATDLPSVQPTDDTPTRPTAPSPDAPSRRPELPESAADADSAGSSFPWLTVLLVVGVGVLLALLVMLPRTLRGRQRERRLGGGPEAAWEELRSTAVDLRLAWPEGRSPRETRDVVVRWFGTPGVADPRPAQGPGLAPDAVAALDRVVVALERARYARRHTSGPGALRDDVLLACEALTAGAPPRVRRRARWVPVSVVQRRKVTDLGRPEVDEPELVGTRSEVL